MFSSTDDLHSRFVGWAKIILPLTALAILSTLFLFARSSNDGTEIPFARINELAKEQRISSPQFSGVSGDGSILEISAQSAQPLEGNLDFLTITAPRLDLTASDGTTLNIIAGEGVVDGPNKRAELTGLARLETSSGYLMETEGLSADFGSGVLRSFGPLAVLAPFAEITAGQVEIRVESQETGQQMYFTKGVRMVYEPELGSEE